MSQLTEASSSRFSPSGLGQFRARVARALGVTNQSRASQLAVLLRDDQDASSYWLQLVLAIVMATLGLALDSTPTVIGAMLVSPLMSPIVDLALALLVGAAWPLVHAIVRVLGSMVVIIVGSVLITWSLPFAELTPQIVARGAPTALDLAVAACCAVAAALSVSRPVSGAASMAAGTAIGISLVPPLCASGFAAGVGNWPVSEGALLLFTANICAILALATLFFWLVGFEPLPSAQAPEPPAQAFGAGAARFLQQAIASRVGVWWRLGIPALMLVAVYVPLDRALTEVSWQVRTRNAMARIVAATPELRDAIDVTTHVERGLVAVRAVIVGTNEQASGVAARLSTQLAAASGVEPEIRVSAVPAAVAEDQRRRLAPEGPSRVATMPEAAQLLQQGFEAGMVRAWPSTGGRILSQRISFAGGPGSPAIVTVAHAAPALDEVARELLAGRLAQELTITVELHTLTAPSEAAIGEPTAIDRWRADALPILAAIDAVPGSLGCVETPASSNPTGDSPMADVIRQWQAAKGESRIVVRPGKAWALRFAPAGCDAGLPQ